MLNHITLMGRLVREPDLRRTQSGTAATHFTLAVERDIKGRDGNREADFIECVAWGARGEFVGKYFRKGSLAIVTGRVAIRDWTDKEGNKRRSAEVNVDNIYFGESKRSEQAAGSPVNVTADEGYSPAANAFEDIAADDDGELPF